LKSPNFVPEWATPLSGPWDRLCLDRFGYQMPS
jgi:hypothetical protein